MEFAKYIPNPKRGTDPLQEYGAVVVPGDAFPVTHEHGPYMAKRLNAAVDLWIKETTTHQGKETK